MEGKRHEETENISGNRTYGSYGGRIDFGLRYKGDAGESPARLAPEAVSCRRNPVRSGTVRREVYQLSIYSKLSGSGDSSVRCSSMHPDPDGSIRNQSSVSE